RDDPERLAEDWRRSGRRLHTQTPSIKPIVITKLVAPGGLGVFAALRKNEVNVSWPSPSFVLMQRTVRTTGIRYLRAKGLSRSAEGTLLGIFEFAFHAIQAVLHHQDFGLMRTGHDIRWRIIHLIGTPRFLNDERRPCSIAFPCSFHIRTASPEYCPDDEIPSSKPKWFKQRVRSPEMTLTRVFVAFPYPSADDWRVDLHPRKVVVKEIPSYGFKRFNTGDVLPGVGVPNPHELERANGRYTIHWRRIILPKFHPADLAFRFAVRHKQLSFTELVHLLDLLRFGAGGAFCGINAFDLAAR
ncbi:hypothetical protein BD410DRAFT_809648, partial [Rickenella mellea]